MIKVWKKFPRNYGVKPSFPVPHPLRDFGNGVLLWHEFDVSAEN
jgi:hypothetical protein